MKKFFIILCCAIALTGCKGAQNQNQIQQTQTDTTTTQARIKQEEESNPELDTTSLDAFNERLQAEFKDAGATEAQVGDYKYLILFFSKQTNIGSLNKDIAQYVLDHQYTHFIVNFFDADGVVSSSSTYDVARSEQVDLLVATSLTSDGATGTKANGDADSAAEQKEIYSLNDTWEVSGQWRLTVTGAEVTDDRNSYSDKTPEEVVYISYTYENLGYEGSIMDLYIVPEHVVDGSGKLADTYPATGKVRPKETPIGVTSDAKVCYGLDNKSETIKIYFEERDTDRETHKAIFEIPVD
ncbi:MAG: hypothetical protein ACOX2M_09530 [Fastidiosipilaceae bacterium]|jgi:hypothetical protein